MSIPTSCTRVTLKVNISEGSDKAAINKRGKVNINAFGLSSCFTFMLNS